MKSLKVWQLVAAPFSFLLLAVMCSGCSSIGGISFIKKSAVNAVVPTIEDMIAVGLSHDDLTLVKSMFEADLILVETLANNSPDNIEVLAVTSKLYGYYSFGFVVADEYEDIDKKERKERLSRARKLYWRGIKYGMQGLKTNKKFQKALDNKVPFQDALQHLGQKELPAAYATSLTMGLNLICSLDVPEIMALSPQFLDLIKWVIETDETFEYGTAHVLLGVFYAIMPAVGGGGPQKALAEFEKGIMIEPDFLLSHFFFARYYPTLLVEDQVFDRELQYIYNTPANKIDAATALNEIAKIKAKSIDDNRDFYF